MTLTNPSITDLTPGLWWLLVAFDPEAPVWVPADLRWFDDDDLGDDDSGWLAGALHEQLHNEHIQLDRTPRGWMLGDTPSKSYPIVAFSRMINPDGEVTR